MSQWAQEQGGGLSIDLLKAELCADGNARAGGLEKDRAMEH